MLSPPPSPLQFLRYLSSLFSVYIVCMFSVYLYTHWIDIFGRGKTKSSRRGNWNSQLNLRNRVSPSIRSHAFLSSELLLDSLLHWTQVRSICIWLLIIWSDSKIYEHHFFTRICSLFLVWMHVVIVAGISCYQVWLLNWMRSRLTVRSFQIL